MSDALRLLQNFEITEEPVRRGSPDNNIGLGSRHNFHSAGEIGSDVAARKNARRGK
jgi:hypothetical protein